MANENAKPIDQYTDEEWKDFARSNPRIVELMSKELEETNTNVNQQVQSGNGTQIASIIKNWLSSLTEIYTRIKAKFTSENIKLVTEILEDILQSFAYSNNNNRENSVAIAFILKSLSEVPTLPTMREIPRIGIYISVLTILIELARIIFSLTFDQEKQEIRNKIARLFK